MVDDTSLLLSVLKCSFQKLQIGVLLSNYDDVIWGPETAQGGLGSGDVVLGSQP